MSLTKMTFDLEKNAWHGVSTESVWIEECYPSSYQVKNTPFYVRGVSYLDLVGGRFEGGLLRFSEVIRHSGHSTYRILITAPIDAQFRAAYWKPLQNLGCSYEENLTLRLTMWAIDVPKETDVHAVYKCLEHGEKKGVWSFEEGHFAGPGSLGT
jgi:Domain of unknown function (DUF4265)